MKHRRFVARGRSTAEAGGISRFVRAPRSPLTRSPASARTTQTCCWSSDIPPFWTSLDDEDDDDFRRRNDGGEELQVAMSRQVVPEGIPIWSAGIGPSGQCITRPEPAGIAAEHHPPPPIAGWLPTASAG